MNPKQVKRNLLWKKALLIGLGWLIAAFFVSLSDYLTLPAQHANFTQLLLLNGGMALFAGLTVGLFEVFILQNKFQRSPFLQVLFFKSLFYTFSIVLINLLAFCHWQSAGNEADCWRSFMHSAALPKSLLSWGAVVILTMLILQINDRLGSKFWADFFVGKYHQPFEEERIFMFLDLKSSTTIAEELGHVRYFELLNDFFNDASYAILQHKGEIYQYVGDEIVISWKKKTGQENDPIEMFFTLQDLIYEKRWFYRKKYRLIPEFKAGIHVGKVTVGEVGMVKKEIVYSGDVLNTTARIQKICNLHQSKLLVSQDIINLQNKIEKWTINPIGETELTGKSQLVRLFSIERA